MWKVITRDETKNNALAYFVWTNTGIEWHQMVAS